MAGRAAIAAWLAWGRSDDIRGVLGTVCAGEKVTRSANIAERSVTWKAEQKRAGKKREVLRCGDLDLELGDDALAQLDINRVVTDGLDVLGEVDLLAIQADADFLGLFLDVAGRDGAEQLAGIAAWRAA